MSRPHITDEKFEGDKSHVLKTRLLYVDAGPLLCDGCDEEGEVAMISMITGGVENLCQTCLQQMADCFDDDIEDPEEILP